MRLLLLLALCSRAASLNIPPEVEQLPTIITQSSSPIIALPYVSSVTIKCEATGNPPPKFRWTRDGHDFSPPQLADPTTGSFVLHNKQLTQYQGKYRCYATNKLGTAMTEEIQMIASGVPKFPKEALRPIVVKEGEPIVLKCNPPDSVVPRQIHWMSINLQHIHQDDRVSMGTDGNLYFSHALKNDSRRDYTCVAAYNKIRTIIQKSPISVAVQSDAAPKLTTPSLLLPSGVQTEVVLLKGKELRLECLPGGFPTPTIEWLKMGVNLPERAKYENFKKLLIISSVDEEVEGKYMCKAHNPAGQAVHYFDVIVEEPPKWLTEPPQNQLTVIGSDVQIKCSVTGKPTPEIKWSRNGEVFRDDPVRRKRVLDDTVILHNASPEDSGVYQCEASNQHGTRLTNVNIMVMNMAPLILTKDHQKYAVVQGGDIVLNCSVFGSPSPSISWTRHETLSDIEGERFSVLPNSFLQIISAESDDSGEYACVASNSEGKSTITARLDVKDQTKIVNPPQDMQVVSGTAAQLTCQAQFDESLRGSFEVTWMKDEEEISLSFEEKYSLIDGMLQIMKVNLSDQGIYTCIARTSLDMDNASALITVLDVPDAPLNLEIAEVQGPRNISLSWVPGADHNSPITEFVVEFEESQWEPGRWKELQKVLGNQATADLNLHGHLNYQFRVYASNVVGPGPPSAPTERHKTPPAAPGRNPENIKIQGHLPHQMEVSWEPLLPIEQNGPGLEYKVSYRRLGLDDLWKEHLENRHAFIVKNTSTFVPYEIKIQSRNSIGWGPEPKIVTGYSGEDVPTAAPRDVGVELINSTVLRVSWTPLPPASVRGHLGGYQVHWLRKCSLLNPSKLLEERHSLSFPGKRNHAIVPGLEPFSEYTLTVNVFNKKGNGPKSDPVTFNTPEGVPDQVPILTTSNAQRDSILLVWGPPAETKGILTGYHLQYHLINETSLEVLQSQERNISGPDTTQWQLQGLEEGSLYRFELSACTQAGCGALRAQESHTVTQEGVASLQRNTSTRGWLIGTMCAVAILTLIVLIACFVRKNKGGKYAGTPQRDQPQDMSMEPVKEKEDLAPDAESQGMNDETFCEYSDSEEKPLKGGSMSSLTARSDPIGDNLSRDSLVDYGDGGGEFDEDGSFIGEYSGPKHRGSVSEPNGHSTVMA